MTELQWIIPAFGLGSYALGWVIGHAIGRRHVGRVRGVIEYGARDPDGHDKIHAHRNLTMARIAADWWRIDGKVYVRRVTDWKATVD